MTGERIESCDKCQAHGIVCKRGKFFWSFNIGPRVIIIDGKGHDAYPKIEDCETYRGEVSTEDMAKNIRQQLPHPFNTTDNSLD